MIIFRKEIRTRTKVYEVAEANVEVEPVNPEEKKKADDLWSDFINDVKGPEKPSRPFKRAASNVTTQAESSGDLFQVGTNTVTLRGGFIFHILFLWKIPEKV